MNPVEATVAALSSPLPARTEAVEIATAVLQEYVRDDACTARLVIDGLTRKQWDELDAAYVTRTVRRETLRALGGGTVIDIEYWMLDDGRGS